MAIKDVRKEVDGYNKLVKHIKEQRQKQAIKKARKKINIKKIAAQIRKGIKKKISLPKVYGTTTTTIKPEGRGKVGNSINTNINRNFFPKRAKK